MQQLVTTRIVIYAKDVSNITGVSKRTAWNILSTLKKKYKKEKNQFITVDEFSDFTGIKKELILPYLK